ncbi:ATP-dependent nuclease [Corynebacterium coyleae]|uniref:ATP-dependent nuclease n=1 Tax=Corynebacterium coyleae TaxID=53374 RepID=UPI000C7617D2|nr:ATP-binding protein [Corynebacterium coyleae]PLA26969.1 hypothetical protein CYJ45_11390 [Corynebacterium coyleae]
MRINQIEITNFKAVKKTSLELHPSCTVIVGANGSGKSSILQAVHWVLQSVRNPKVKPNRGHQGSTVPERDAFYMPSQEYRKAGNFEDYASNKQRAQLDLSIKAEMDDGTIESANSWIKSARNEGLSVWAPSANQIVQRIRDNKREISAYIPGLAGIPLSEEKRSRLVVRRQAAAGDANTVLRNLLVLLSETDAKGENGLDLVSAYVSEVMGTCKLRTTFDEDSQVFIKSEFSYGDSPSKFVPLEMAGIGFLQVIQIFSYLVYFRPRLLLVDEPDAHLYPLVQEKLVTTLISAAEKFECQLVLATHSPSIVRALGEKGSVIWMKEGEVQPEGDTRGRSLMGWGLLDRRIVLMTEDEDSQMIRTILSQWPHLERAVAVWPLNGSSKIPDPTAVKAFESLVGDSIKVLVHRDRDFLMPEEAELVEKKYLDDGVAFWTTRDSDVEAYWVEQETVERHFGISSVEAQNLIDDAVETCKNNDSLVKVRNKRADALKKLNSKGQLPHYGDREVLAEAAKHGSQFQVLGKTLLKAIRSEAHSRGLRNSAQFGTTIPEGVELAKDLRTKLTEMIDESSDSFRSLT